MHRNTRILFGLSAALLLMTLACATQPTPAAYDPPGFLLGLLHGVVAPFALVGSFFTEFRMYAFPNSGVWYDFGFILGLSAWAGGAASA